MAAYDLLTKIFTHISLNENELKWLKLELQLNPPQTAEEAKKRANNIAQKSADLYLSLKGDDVSPLFETVLDVKEDLNPSDQKNLQLMWDVYQREVNLPTKVVADLARATAIFTAAHPKLKADNDWEIWSSYLNDAVRYSQQKAAVLQQQLGGETPYDALLSWYSGGTTAQELEDLFQPYEAVFPQLLQHALAKQKNEPALEPLPVIPLEKQKEVATKILEVLGFDFEEGSMGVGASASCETAHGHTFVQVRIDPENILAMIRTACHEGGHALYHQGLPVEHASQPVGQVQSYLVSEMVAYLYEHHVALNPNFLTWVTNEVGMDAALLIAHSRKVTPSTVSIGCDELSLSVHPLIRFPFDRGLINDSTAIEDLPRLWNWKTGKLLGMDAGDAYNEGVMAPVHWSKGYFGYFPIYLAAQMAAAQLAKGTNVKMRIACHGVETGLSNLRSTLTADVFSQGSLLETNELIQWATGSKLTAAALIKHLSHRYT